MAFFLQNVSIKMFVDVIGIFMVWYQYNY